MSSHRHGSGGDVTNQAPPVWLNAVYKGKPFLDEVVAGADHLLSVYPNSDFIGIGQSPAWMLWTANIMCDRRAMCHSHFRLVPFSGTHTTREQQSYEQLDGNLIKSFSINRPRHLHLYRRRLSKMAICPANLIRNHKESGKTAVFTDYCKSGGGLASFMHILCKWASDEGLLDDFLKSIAVHALIDPSDGPGFDAMKFPDLGVALPVTKQYVSTQFAHHFADGDNHSNLDRLIQYYPQERWLNAPLPISSYDVTSACGSRLASVVDAHEAKIARQRRAAVVRAASVAEVTRTNT